MRAAAHILDRLSHHLNSAALVGAMLAVGVMVFAALYQVVARYIFFAPPVWTEELARYAMIWAGLLGASVAFRYRADPTLFPDKRLIGGTRGLLLALFRFIGVFIFIMPVLHFCFFGPNQNPLRSFIMRNVDKSAELLGMSMIFVAAAIPIGFLLIAVHAIAVLAVRLAEISDETPRKENP